MKKIKKYIQKSFHYYLYDLNLNAKLLTAFLALSLLLLGASSVATIQYVSNIIKNQLMVSATETFHQTTISLKNTFSSYEQITLGLSISDTFDDLMALDMDSYTYVQQFREKQNLEKKLFSTIPPYINNSAYPVNVKIYFNHGFDYFNNNSRYFRYKDYQNEPWFQRIMDGYTKDRTGYYVIPGSLLSLSPKESEETCALVRVIVDKDYYPNQLALLRLDISRDYIANLITSTTFEGTVSGVITSDNHLLTLSKSAPEELYTALTDEFRAKLPEFAEWTPIELNDTVYLLHSVSIPEYDLVQFSLIPERSFYSDLFQVRSFLIILSVVMMLLCIPLANLISRGVSLRLNKVVETMSLTRKGEIVPFTDTMSIGKDEIGEVISSYNYMVEQLQLLIEKEYEHGKEIKNAELKALQAQINPHFLYNILDMIYWFAEEGMSEEISIAVKALSTFYRISLSKGKEIITLKEEAAHVGAYIKLQNLRFQNSIHYEAHIDPSLMNCLIVKTTFQPIIENAILHGIQEKDDSSGTITLDIHPLGAHDIEITITDDGIGMDEATVTSLNQNTLVSDPNHGYGVRNVQARLQLFYGSSYGLTYASKPGKGTTVYIKIPNKKVL